MNQAVVEADGNELRKADKSKKTQKGQMKSKRFDDHGVGDARPVGRSPSKEDAALTTIHLMN